LQLLFSRYSKYREDANEKGIAARKRSKETEDSWEIAKCLLEMDDSIDEMNKWSANIEGVMQILEAQAKADLEARAQPPKPKIVPDADLADEPSDFEGMEGEEGNGEQLFLNEDLTGVPLEADGSNDGPSSQGDADEEKCTQSSAVVLDPDSRA
jgi:hypothetical protein